MYIMIYYIKWSCMISMQGVPTIVKKLGDFLLSLFLVTSERLGEKSPLTKTTCLPVTCLSQPFIIFKNIVKLFF